MAQFKHFLKDYIIIWLMVMLGLNTASSQTATNGQNGLSQSPKIVDLTAIINPRWTGIGLALSGGGAQGFAQIGVLKVLEENGVPVSHIAGTSIGAVIGGLYASGYSARDLEQLAYNTNWKSLFSDSPGRLKLFLTQRQQREKHLVEIRFDGLKPYVPQGITAGQKISDYLYKSTMGSRYETGANFDCLRIPFRAVATDLVTGESVILSSGDLAESIRAAVSIPLAFSPVEYGNQLLVDGGLVCPVPVDVVRKMGAEKVIAVNTVSQLYSREHLKSALDIANQATTIMVMDKTIAQLHKADLVIQPDLSNYANTEFDDIPAIIREGEKAAYEMLPRILELLNRPNPEPNTAIFVDEVRTTFIPDDCQSSDLSGLCDQYDGKLVSSIDIQILKERILSTGDYACADFDTTLGAEGAIIDIEMQLFPVIREIKFMGNTVFSNEILEKYLGIEIDKRLNSRMLQSGLQRIENLYRNSHYSLVNIMAITLNVSDGILLIEIDEGLIADLKITGNEYTRGWVIKRDFPEVIGRPYNSLDINKGVEHLYNSGLFERVTTNIVDHKDGYYTLQLNMREKYPRAARFGVRYDDEYNLQGLIDAGDYNLAGTGSELALNTVIGDRQRELNAEFRADRIFKTFLAYSINARIGHKEMDIFIDHRPRKEYFRNYRGAGLRIGQQISRLGAASVELRVEDIEDKSLSGEKNLMRIRSLILRSVVDTKSSNTFPESGKYHLSYLEWGSDILGGNDIFSKFYVSVESYYPLPFGLNFHPRAALGISINGLPLSEKFYLNEPDGFAGFHRYEIYGDNFFGYHLRLRKKIGDRYYPYLRYDAGDIYSDKSEVKLRNLKHGLQGGIGISTILGPLDISYGIYEKNLDKFYISWGYNF